VITIEPVAVVHVGCVGVIDGAPGAVTIDTFKEQVPPTPLGLATVTVTIKVPEAFAVTII